MINNAATVVPGAEGTLGAQAAAEANKGAPDYTKSVAPGSFSDFKLNMDA